MRKFITPQPHSHQSTVRKFGKSFIRIFNNVPQIEKNKDTWRSWLRPWTQLVLAGSSWTMYTVLPTVNSLACIYSAMYSIMNQHCSNCSPYCSFTVMAPNQVVRTSCFTHTHTDTPTKSLCCFSLFRCAFFATFWQWWASYF